MVELKYLDERCVGAISIRGNLFCASVNQIINELYN
jgi:hypothetical protein